MGSLRGSPNPSIYGSRGGGTIAAGGGNYAPPKSLLMAISEIQSYFIFETKGENIDPDLFSVSQVRDFFSTGSRTGMAELFFMFIFFPVFGFLMPSFLEFFYGKISLDNHIFYWFMAIMPILGFMPICIYLSRFYAGQVTKKAITALLGCRAAALGLSGLFSGIIYLVLYYISGNVKTGHYFVSAAYFFHRFGGLPPLRKYYSLWFYSRGKGEFIDIAVVVYSPRFFRLPAGRSVLC